MFCVNRPSLATYLIIEPLNINDFGGIQSQRVRGPMRCLEYDVLVGVT
jgi:hypothetical protein